MGLPGPALFCSFRSISMRRSPRTHLGGFFSYSQLHLGGKGMVRSLWAGCQGWGPEPACAPLAIQIFYSIKVCGEGEMAAQVGVIWLFKAGITVGSLRSRAPPTPSI